MYLCILHKSQPLNCRRADGGYWVLWRQGHPDLHVLDGLVRARFYGVYRVGQIRFDHPLITAMIERWQVETYTFHLPVDESTITLQDVEVLMGLPTIRSPITHTEDGQFS